MKLQKIHLKTNGSTRSYYGKIKGDKDILKIGFNKIGQVLLQ